MPGNSGEAVEPAEPFDARKFVRLMNKIELGIALEDSDEDEDEDGDTEWEEDENGDVFMVPGTGRPDHPEDGTSTNPVDLTVWDLTFL